MMKYDWVLINLWSISGSRATGCRSRRSGRSVWRAGRAGRSRSGPWNSTREDRSGPGPWSSPLGDRSGSEPFWGPLRVWALELSPLGTRGPHCWVMKEDHRSPGPGPERHWDLVILQTARPVAVWFWIYLRNIVRLRRFNPLGLLDFESLDE